MRPARCRVLRVACGQNMTAERKKKEISLPHKLSPRLNSVSSVLPSHAARRLKLRLCHVLLCAIHYSKVEHMLSFLLKGARAFGPALPPSSPPPRVPRALDGMPGGGVTASAARSSLGPPQGVAGRRTFGHGGHDIAIHHIIVRYYVQVRGCWDWTGLDFPRSVGQQGPRSDCGTGSSIN